ncbi:MAG: class I SAM-dependent methyltransferase [Ignavibacteria bacterium]|nr:class I SAM-dependent methyltransferase [Ignavibacteria bacterium]
MYFTKIFSKSARIELSSKNKEELLFWQNEVDNYIKWYDGEIAMHYDEATPSVERKIYKYNKKENAILTWFETHQKTKYIEDLKIKSDAFTGIKVLDIGSGPFPNASFLNNCEVYNLDPLLPYYLLAGFPLHIYNGDIKFIYGYSEKIPVEDNYFDLILSLNALDHVDNFEDTAREIKRVLKGNGKLRFHIHYHKKTKTEPLELNDKIVSEAFSWCNGFKKISETKKKRGSVVTNFDEKYTLWTNFD